MTFDDTGSVLWVDEGEIGTTLDGTDDQELWEALTPEQRHVVAVNVYDTLITSDTVWGAYHAALDEALAWFRAEG